MSWITKKRDGDDFSLTFKMTVKNLGEELPKEESDQVLHCYMDDAIYGDALKILGKIDGKVEGEVKKLVGDLWDKLKVPWDEVSEE